jgi:alpha-methylacyl-CoA racemase
MSSRTVHRQGEDAAGPLAHIHAIEFSGLGPGPFGTMLLADLGAKVIRIDRPGAKSLEPATDVLGRSRRSIAIDLVRREGREIALRLLEDADVLVEGYRPGVMERLGLGPADCTAVNARLIYARMTGWGQSGPLAERAGHDLNYIAVAGALHSIGHADRPPVPPLNLVGDFGGGGAFLALGVVAALFERERSGVGQVLDVAMVDGAASLTAIFHGLVAGERWNSARQANVIDGGAHFYNTYSTLDGKYVAVAAIEEKFYLELLSRLGLEAADWPQYATDRWPDLSMGLAAIFATRTRDEWERVFQGADACVAPVLDFGEATAHAHAVARNSFVEVAGVRQPAPAPRFSRTSPAMPRPAPRIGEQTDAILSELGFAREEIKKLRARNVIA